MRVRALATVVALTAILTACAERSPGPASESPTPIGGAIEHPEGPADLVLRIEVTGGFVAPDTLFTRTHEFSLFGDGTIVVPGAQPAIYPSPALPALLQRSASEDAIQLILQDGLDAGLDRDAEYLDMGHVMIADAATTVFTMTANGQTHTSSVYALGDVEGQRPEGMPVDEWQARKAMQSFEAAVNDLSWLPEGSLSQQGPFAGGAAALLVGGYTGDPQLPQQPVAWPLNDPLATFGTGLEDLGSGQRCGIVQGQDWESLSSLARGANQLTPWTSGGERYALAFRVLLPDEKGC